ncbi:aminoglycoside phosphotransferase family protein [Propioniciclava soli]|uniref:aminoglycoside phosphotransferase family protein n=1 Tax=Propioniciclava soli TaxID=2775081 RepID=UPI001E4FB1F8|nr:aminoglycoside phosphotransferase family protein [Propioniciclava soli]
MADDDGAELLSSDAVAGLLGAAVEHAGGTLESWALDHIDANPRQSTTATYSAVVAWPWGRRSELLGVSARAQGPTAADSRAEIFADGEREVAVWLYPNDPDLPGLARAAYPSSLAAVLSGSGAVAGPLPPESLELEMIAYRPRRRAVLRARVADGPTFYVKVLRERLFADVSERHALLADAGVPAPPVVATTPDHLLVLGALPGTPLARAVFDEAAPCTAEDLIGVLDAMPPTVAGLGRRPPWSDAVDHYTAMVAAALPAQHDRLHALADAIRTGLAPLPPGDEPTHGDFHEGQIHVDRGRVAGILDVDTIGPGRRADDLACLIAHLSTIQRMSSAQAARVRTLLQAWVPVFDARVDPVELRLRAAAVIISLATGPYRGQEPDWQRETTAMVDAAEALVRQVL